MPRGSRTSPEYSQREWRINLYRWARRRAKDRGIPFSLTYEDLEAIIDRAAGRCEVTGIAFSFRKPKKGRTRPWAPSLDRRNSDLGYTKRNVRLVCTAANYAMCDWGDQVLKRIAAAMRKCACGGT